MVRIQQYRFNSEMQIYGMNWAKTVKDVRHNYVTKWALYTEEFKEHLWYKISTNQ